MGHVVSVGGRPTDEPFSSDIVIDDEGACVGRGHHVRPHHVHPHTADRWLPEGELPVQAQRVGGLIVIGDLLHPVSGDEGPAAIYARASLS